MCDMTIRPGTSTDFATVMDRCAASFADGNANHLLFEDLYPDSVRATEASMQQWQLVEIDGEIAAGMQVVPRPMTIAGDVRLQVAGLGNVFCYPPFRKQELMSHLLERVLAVMASNGDAVSLLEGDRLRYGRYGWENAGTARVLNLRSSMLRGQDGLGSITDFRRWKGEAEDARRMAAAYRALPTRTDRTDAEFERVLKRPAYDLIWLSEYADGFAYVALAGGRILEYGGDLDAFKPLLRFLVSRRPLEVAVPPVAASGLLEAFLLELAADFAVQPVGMACIIDLHRTLQAYAPLLKRRLAGWRGALSLAIEGRGAGVACTGEGDGLRIEPAPAPYDLSLSAPHMARLLFGPFAPHLTDLADHEFLRRALPLPLYWHALSHV